MNDHLSNGTTGRRSAPSRPEPQTLEKPPGGRATGGRARQERLEKLVAQAVARQSEALAEMIVQRVVEEVGKRNRPEPAFLVEDHDPIERIPLPTRVAKVMRRMGVRTIGQLTALHEEDLIDLRNLGPSSLRQLHRILALFGRQLAG